MDLVEGGDVRRLFSDAELLELAGAEEEHERRRTTNGTYKPGVKENDSLTSRELAGAGADSRRPRLDHPDEARDSGESGQGGPATPYTGSQDEA